MNTSKIKTMKKEDAIKYLQQLYPNGGHCWLDEQRIEAISMAINALQEEPVSEDFDALDQLLAKYAIDFSYKGKTLKECSGRYKAEIIATANHLEPVSEDLEEAAKNVGQKYFPDENNVWAARPNYEAVKAECAFKKGTQWQKEHLWKPADGDDLPIFDREVIVLIKYNTQRNIHDKEYSTYKVGFGHRPNPDGWDGKNIDTNEVTHYTPKLYDKGGWNAPDIVYWLDVELPKEIEL